MIPFFSVVIPTYNRRARLMLCLEALSKQTLPPAEFEVIVVDDGSTDDTWKSLRQMSFPFKVNCLTIPNSGASAARNAGMAAAKGKFIALTEDDVLPSPDWLLNARRHLDPGRLDLLEGKTVSGVSGRSVRRFDSGAIPSFIPCNLFVGKQVIDRVGGYDPSFYDAATHLYFREDADFGFRALDAGCSIGLAADVVVAHPEQFQSFQECLRHSRRYVFDPLLYRKHPVRFRQMIEVKRVMGLPVHRPQHYVALVYFALLCVLILKWISGDLLTVSVTALVLVLCSFAFRYKYQGWGAVRLYRLGETLGFFWLPLVYLWAVVRGCFRFGSFGALV